MDINQYISSGIIEMYVLGLCSPEEAAELELLRTQQPSLNEAILKFEAELERTYLNDATQPGAAIDKEIMQALHAMQTPVIPLHTQAGNTATIKKMNWLKPVAAAAIALFAVSSIFNYTLYNKTRQQQLAITEAKKITTLPQNDYAVLKTPGITPVAMYGVFPHNICRCTLFWDKKTGKAYMMVHHLMPVNKEKSYQLWAMVNDKPVNVGMINERIRDRFIEVQNVPEGATAFTVTLENASGSTSPTADEIYLYGKII
jgi:anti-sigma-K factor RskA